MEEIVALKELVGEFGKGHTVLELTVEPTLHAVLGHHIVDRDALANLAGKIEEGVILHPVEIVDELGLVGGIALKVEKSSQLLLDAGHVVAKRLLVEQIAFLALSAGVANHSRGTSHESQRLVAATLEMAQHHHATEMSDVEAVCGGVDAHIGGHGLLGQQFLGSRHDGVNHASPFKFLYKVHVVMSILSGVGCV